MNQEKFDLLKSHIDAFTRKDGSVVAAHDDKRQAAQPKAAPLATHADHDDASSKMIQHGMDLEDTGYKRGASTHAEGGVKNGYSVAYSHDDGRTATASMSRSKSAKGAWDTKLSHGSSGPAEGEVGHEEHKAYGKYFKKGDKVKDGSGNQHTVASHRGPEVRTESGKSFHPTKLDRA